MSETKITSASVKVTLAYNSNFFGVELTIENEDGILQHEINDARLQAEELAKAAVTDYKRVPNIPVKDEIRKLKNKITELDAEVNGKVEKPVDPKEIEAVQKLPMYKSKSSGK